MKRPKNSSKHTCQVGVLLVLMCHSTSGARNRALSLGARPLIPSGPTFVTFDAPGAVYGTFPAAMNPAEVITGYFNDENFMSHGFVRAERSHYTFDVPQAAGGFFILTNINPVGVIIGTFFDADFVRHGFVRTTDGTITTLDIPNAVNGSQAIGFNPQRAITGTYTDADFVTHGLLRASDGTLSTFDPPAAGYMREFALFSFGSLVSITPDGVIQWNLL
jgi:hypothetical protein